MIAFSIWCKRSYSASPLHLSPRPVDWPGPPRPSADMSFSVPSRLSRKRSNNRMIRPEREHSSRCSSRTNGEGACSRLRFFSSMKATIKTAQRATSVFAPYLGIFGSVVGWGGFTPCQGNGLSEVPRAGVCPSSVRVRSWFPMRGDHETSLRALLRHHGPLPQ